MTIGGVSGSSPSTESQVILFKGQQSQQTKVVSTLLGSATDTSSITGKGQKVDVKA